MKQEKHDDHIIIESIEVINEEGRARIHRLQAAYKLALPPNFGNLHNLFHILRI